MIMNWINKRNKFQLLLIVFLVGINVNSISIQESVDTTVAPISMNYDDYMNALYMSIGLKEHNNTFMRQFYNQMYNYEFFPDCSCNGCSINNVCLPCVKKRKCIAINGTYC